MKKTLNGIRAIALVSALSSCGGKEEAANNLDTDDMNATTVDSNNMNNMSGHDMNNI